MDHNSTFPHIYKDVGCDAVDNVSWLDKRCKSSFVYTHDILLIINKCNAWIMKDCVNEGHDQNDKELDTRYDALW